MITALAIFFGFLMLALIVQAWFNIYTSIYGWVDPEAIEKQKAAKQLLPPKHSFTVLLPAYHEEAVIGHTIEQIANCNYPRELVQILVLCRAGDSGTIAAAAEAIVNNGITNAQVLPYLGKVAGKPVQLNQGLVSAAGDFTVIFDAEDDVSPDIFAIANTMYQKYDIDILQAGVQLMDYNTRWYSVHNVMEYYFQFRSRMYFQAKQGVVALGGNTCFFKTEQLREYGGWDKFCLTEDAEIGLRLSSAGKKFDVFYDSKSVTREETPPTMKDFIKQRTRWNQGFLQTIGRGYWRSLPTFHQKLLAIYILGLPIMQAMVLLLTPILIFLAFTVKFPVIISLLSFTPFGLLLLLFATHVVGLREFAKEHELKIPLRTYVAQIFTSLPYQYVLSYAAFRALKREMFGNAGWEKTAHNGAHREVKAVVAKQVA